MSGDINLIINTPARAAAPAATATRSARPRSATRSPASPPWRARRAAVQAIAQARKVDADARSRTLHAGRRWSRMPPRDRPARCRSLRVEAVGAYTLLVLRNDGGEVGPPGQFSMLQADPEPARRYLPRALSAAWAERARSRSCWTCAAPAPSRAGTGCARSSVLGAARQRLRAARRAGDPGRRRHRRGHPALAGARGCPGR